MLTHANLAFSWWGLNYKIADISQPLVTAAKEPLCIVVPKIVTIKAAWLQLLFILYPFSEYTDTKKISGRHVLTKKVLRKRELNPGPLDPGSVNLWNTTATANNMRL